MEPGKLDEFFDKMDANNDGQLSYEEFAAAMQTDKFLMDALLKPTNKQGLANRVAAWNSNVRRVLMYRIQITLQSN